MQAEVLFIIAGMAAVTYLTRISFLALAGKVYHHGLIFRGLKYIPIGILTAFVVPGLLVVEGRVSLSPDNYYLLAGLVSGLVAFRWKNVFLAMGSGILAMVALQMVRFH